jgi:hypothetical protein
VGNRYDGLEYRGAVVSLTNYQWHKEFILSWREQPISRRIVLAFDMMRPTDQQRTVTRVQVGEPTITERRAVLGVEERRRRANRYLM